MSIALGLGSRAGADELQARPATLRFGRHPADPAADQAPRDAPPVVPSVFALSPFVAEEPGAASGMTLGELESIALGNNPTLSRARARVQVARGNWIQVGLRPNPVIGYSGGEMGDEGTAGQQGGFIAQKFVTAGKLRLNRAVAGHQIAQAEQELAAQQLRVLTDVRTSYHDVLVAQRRVDLTGRLVQIGEDGARTADALLKAQEASRVDLLQARVEVDSTRILLVSAQKRHQAAWRTLAAVVGVPEMPPTALRGNLEDLGPALRWEDALGRLLSESPELAAAMAEVDRARWALRRARVEWIPNVGVQADLQQNHVTGDAIASVELGLPLPLFDRNQGKILSTNAELIAAQRNVERIRLNLQKRLAKTFEQYATARNQVEKYKQVILPNAKASLDLVTTGYQQGEFGYLTLLTAQRTFFRSNLAYIEALRELKSASETIEGLLLSDSLGAGR